MMRIAAALLAMVAMSGCTLVVLGTAGEAKIAGHDTDDAELGKVLVDAVLLDLTAAALIGSLVYTPEPTTSTMSWR
jgi:hypothetical protein